MLRSYDRSCAPLYGARSFLFGSIIRFSRFCFEFCIHSFNQFTQFHMQHQPTKTHTPYTIIYLDNFVRTCKKKNELKHMLKWQSTCARAMQSLCIASCDWKTNNLFSCFLSSLPNSRMANQERATVLVCAILKWYRCHLFWSVLLLDWKQRFHSRDRAEQPVKRNTFLLHCAPECPTQRCGISKTSTRILEHLITYHIRLVLFMFSVF